MLMEGAELVVKNNKKEVIKQLPYISIVIPVYNVEKYIAECLNSVMRQTYAGGIECIIVDDCGTDGSMTIAEQLIENYNGAIKFVIVHHAYNRGLSTARNTGTDVATGDYVYYIDSDDYISDDCIENLAAPLAEKCYDIVLGDYEMFGDRHDSTLLQEQQNELIGNERIFSSYAGRKIYVMAWNKLCRLSFLRDNNIIFLEGQLHEDELWTYKTMLSIQSIKIIHKEVYYYRVRANSIATDNTKASKKLSSYCDTIEYIHLHPHPNIKAYYQCLFYYWDLYLSIGIKNRISFLGRYIRLRHTLPYKPIADIISGQMSIKQIRGKLSFSLPPVMAYCYLKIRNRYLEARTWMFCS